MTERFNTKEEATTELQRGIDNESDIVFNPYALNAYCPLIKTTCNHSCVCYAEPRVDHTVSPTKPLRLNTDTFLEHLGKYKQGWFIIKGSCTNRMFTKD